MTVPNRQHRRQVARLAKKARRSGRTAPGGQGFINDSALELEAAVRSHQMGELQNAANAYRRILDRHPDHYSALHLLGVVAYQTGQSETAVKLIRRALACRPDFVAAHNSLGAALQTQGELAKAADCYRKALAIDPRYARAHNNLGVVLEMTDGPQAAISCFERALAINPDYPEAHNHIGMALTKQGKMNEAVARFQKALGIDPSLVEAHNNLGNVLKDQGKSEEASACFQCALDINPNFGAAHSNLAGLLKDQDKLHEAAACYHRALAIDPNMVEAHNGLGAVVQSQGNLDEAVVHFQRALDINPEFATAHSNLICTLNFSAASTPEEILAESRRWAAIHTAQSEAKAKPHTNDPSPERRLRVGYVSPDFRNHSVAYFVEPLLAAHDRKAVEVTCYAEVARPDGATARLHELAEHWRTTVGMRDSEVAERIREDRIDILVDMAGHTAKNRLLVFAERPAPVQAAWLGYGATTGMLAVDYRLSDAVADPVGVSESHYTETLVRLPDAFFCYAPPEDAPEVGSLPALEHGHVTFGSFNNLIKVTPEVVEAWARILQAVPGSRLLFKSRPLADTETRARYLELFAARGIEAERLDLVPWIATQAGHFAAYGKVDIVLDPFPYNGGTTSLEALWMGVPVVASRGDRFLSRMGASILIQLGLSDLLAETTEAYVEHTVDLANDLDRLAALRRDLRPRMAVSPLCDAETFARNMEAAYRGMWQFWCNAEAVDA